MTNQNVTPTTATGDAPRTPPLILAWSDPAVADTPAGAAAGRALLQSLALIDSYAARTSGAPDQVWAQAMANLPLTGTLAQGTETLSANDVGKLTGNLAQHLAQVAGATDADAAQALLPAPSGTQTDLDATIVQTWVAQRQGAVVAGMAVVAVRYASTQHELPLPHRTWTLAQTTSQVALDYPQLDNRKTRSDWDALMANVDTATITSLPTYHRLP